MWEAEKAVEDCPHLRPKRGWRGHQELLGTNTPVRDGDIMPFALDGQALTRPGPGTQIMSPSERKPCHLPLHKEGPSLQQRHGCRVGSIGDNNGTIVVFRHPHSTATVAYPARHRPIRDAIVASPGLPSPLGAMAISALGNKIPSTSVGVRSSKVCQAS